MPGISLKNGLISYYGNPAGYTEKENAVVDNIFQSNELSAWLKSRSLTPQWTDGVMERLLAGERLGGIETAAPLKNVRIWQLKPDVDIHMKFISYEEMVRKFGEPSPGNYRIAYDGQLDTNDPETIYERYSIRQPPGFSGNPLSMSDVIELYNAAGSEFYYADRKVFRQIEFESPEPIQTMDMSM